MMSQKDLDRDRAAKRQTDAIYYTAIKLTGPYDPCPCGSGKKFKFCCKATVKDWKEK